MWVEVKFSVGLFIGLVISGVPLIIGVSQSIGIVILVIGAIWGFLFVCPVSPARERWWSVSGKLGFLISEESGYRARASNEYISVWIELVSWSGIMVDRIVLKIGRKKVSCFDWRAHVVAGRAHGFVDFVRPDWLDRGVCEAELVAYTREGYCKSKKFMVEVS